MASQVAGPSRVAFNCIPESRSVEERQRLIASNKKAEHVLGATAPALFDLPNKPHKAQAGPIVLNSPISSAPPSAFRWDTRMYTNFADRPMSSSGSTEGSSMPPSPSSAQNYVPPLKFKRDSSRANSNSSSAEAELLEFRRDISNLSLNGSSSSPSHEDKPDTLARSDSSLKRHPRPLPPVPLSASRPASPVSTSSSSNTPSGPMRPLPPPPDLSSSKRPLSGESVSTIGFAPPSPHLKCLIPNTSTASLILSPIEDEEAPEKDASSPASIASEDTDATSVLSILTPKFGMFMHDTNDTSRPPIDANMVGTSSSGADRKHKHGTRVHASPYKLARSASRYSVTSLSSQVSVPPAPPAEEIRRRNREKMSKLIRMLGDSPPADMVFAIESAYAELQASLDKEVGIAKAKQSEIAMTSKISKPKVDFIDSPLNAPSMSAPPSIESKSHGRSISLTNDFDSLYTKKSLTDPDAGHFPLSPINSRSTSTTNTTSNTMSPLARLRLKKGRQGTSAERYVVSLAGSDAERVSLRLAGSGATPNRRHPAGSYLRGAYKFDTRAVEVKVPPLPKSRVSLLATKAKLSLPQEKADKAKDTNMWLRDAGSTRWEMEDYENIVNSLRKL